MHKTIRKRWDDIFRVGGRISPIKRWPDVHYTPHAIPVQPRATGQDYVITAQLSGFESPDVHVDVHHGFLIILAARGGIESDGEHYCEAPLPADINQNRAEVTFREGVLTVSFRKPGWRMTALKIALAKFNL